VSRSMETQRTRSGAARTEIDCHLVHRADADSRIIHLDIDDVQEVVNRPDEVESRSQVQIAVRD
jgi:hypothetical protein